MSAKSGGTQVVHGPFEGARGRPSSRARCAAASGRAPGAAPLLIRGALAPCWPTGSSACSPSRKGLPLLGVHFHTFHSLAAAVVEEGGADAFFGTGADLGPGLPRRGSSDRVLDPRAVASGSRRSCARRRWRRPVRSSLARTWSTRAWTRGRSPSTSARSSWQDEEDALAPQTLCLALSAAYDRELGRLGVLAPSALTRPRRRGRARLALAGGLRRDPLLRPSTT